MKDVIIYLGLIVLFLVPIVWLVLTLQG